MMVVVYVVLFQCTYSVVLLYSCSWDHTYSKPNKTERKKEIITKKKYEN